LSGPDNTEGLTDQAAGAVSEKTPDALASPVDASTSRKQKKRRRHPAHAIGSAAAIVMLVIIVALVAGLVIRFGALTAPGLAIIEHRLNGLKVDRSGWLVVSGLKGDPFGRFSVERVQIHDQDGVWIEGTNLVGEWSPLMLFAREVRFDSATADQVTMLRRPTLLPKPRRIRESPVSVQVNNIRTIVRTMPAVSVVDGLYDVAGSFQLIPGNGTVTRVDARSRRQARDFATGLVRARRDQPVVVNVRARGAQGGAIAGMLGLDPFLPFSFDLDVSDKDHVSAIKLYAITGQTVLADLNGTLTRQGGVVAGVVRLNGSRLTARLAEIIGDRLDVDARLGPAGANGLQQLKADLGGERATLVLDGPVRRASGWQAQGLRASLDVASLGSVLGRQQVAGGAASLDGLLNGSWEALSFAGSSEASGIVAAGLVLNRVGGPVSISRTDGGRGLLLTADLSASAGGRGALAGWIGPAPRLEGQARFLPGRGWILESGSFTGAGIVATGKGGVDLLGRVRSEGSAVADAGRTAIAGATGRLPFDWSVTSQPDGLYRIDAKGRGEDFRTGNAWFDAIIGPRPVFDAALNIGGPGLEFRRLILKLAQLEVDATGRSSTTAGTTLAGSFTGELAALGLDRLSGSLAGRFEASQRQAGGIAVNFNGRSRQFLASLGALDPLIGVTPDISGTVIANGSEILLNDIKVAGSSLTASATGRIRVGTDVAMRLAWSAFGPINIGPLQLSGNPAGTGAIVGPVSSLMLTVDARLEQLTLPQLVLSPARFELALPLASGSDGTATLTGTSAYGVVTARSKVQTLGQTIKLDDLSASGAGLQVDGSAEIGNGGAFNGQFDVVATPGLFVEAGRLQGRVAARTPDGGALQLELDLQGRSVGLRSIPGLRFSALSVQGQGGLERLPLTIQARLSEPANGSFNGALVYGSSGGKTVVTLSGTGEAAGLAYSTTSPVRLEMDNEVLRLEGNVRARNPGSDQSAFVDFNLSRENGRLRGTAALEDVALSLLSPDLSGTISANATLDGRDDRLTGSFEARLDRALSRGLPQDLALGGVIRGTLSDRQLTLDGNLSNPRSLSVEIDTVIPVEASAEPMRLALVRNAPLSGAFRMVGEIRPVADLIFAGERTINGPLRAEGTIGGTINQPLLGGTITLTNGEWLEPRIGLRMRELSLDAALEGDTILVRKLEARDGDQGRVDGSGRIRLGNSAEPSTFEARLTRFKLFDTDRGEAAASGRVTIERFGDGRAQLSGRLDVQNAEFRPAQTTPAGAFPMDVIEINRPERPGRSGNSPQLIDRNQANAPSIGLNIELAADRGIFVRGRGLNLELDLDARVTGTTSRPVLTGEAGVYRGGYTYGGRVFDFEEGGTIRLAADANEIRLNLAAVREADDLDARIEITGTAADPRVVLTSVPPLPQDEILSRVLFGRSTAQLSGPEAIQLASGLAALAGGDSFDVVGNLRDLVALDRLTFTYGAAGLEVAGGKYLGRDVYLELINEPDVGVISQVEWRPVRGLAITSRVTPDGDARVAVRWRQSINRD
jgi:translocation and assembly module TamB